MAGRSRGFYPLKEQLKTTSIYVPYLYNGNVKGFVMDPSGGKEYYSKSSMSVVDQAATSDGRDDISTTATASQIVSLLPDE